MSSAASSTNITRSQHDESGFPRPTGHNIAPIRSIYRWRGQIYDVSEARVALHTRASLVAEIIERTTKEHPYEVPCVVALPVVDGNPEYLSWVLAETKPA
jgi:periplasmic divalent cation tolerance protein